MSIDQMIRELRSLEEKNKNRTYSTFETKWNQVCCDTAEKLEEVKDISSENESLKKQYRLICKGVAASFQGTP